MSRRRGVLAYVGGVLVVLLAIVVAVTVIRRNLDEAVPAATAPRGVSATAAVLADQPAADGFVAGATSAIGAVTTYDYRDLGSALATGLAVTTGDYRTAYRDALRGDLGASARRDRLVQTYQVLQAGIGQVSSDGRTAKVLIFGVETVTRGAGAGRDALSTLTATVVHRGDAYLISALEVGANAGLPPSTPQLPVAAEAGRRKVLDTVGTVTAVAIVSATGGTVVMLVAATGARVAGDGTTSVGKDERLEVTVVRSGGRWQVSDVQPVTS